MSSSGVWAQQFVGRKGPASTYALFLPRNWNGDAVFYAHGFRDVSEPVNLPTADGIEAFRDALGELGYAVAYSSFDANGFAFKDGLQRTHQLRGLFAARYGKPRRSFLAGHSLGGGITLALAQRYPKQYAGTLAMCGIVGGTERQVDYVANVRVLFDFFYPGVLPGNAISMPENVDLLGQVILPALGAVQANPTGAGAIAAIAQTPLEFGGPTELVQSLVRALGFQARGANNVAELTHGHNAFDNSATVYTGGLPGPLLQAINAGVARFRATRDADNYEARYFEPNGDLEIPVLTLHNARDPSVPRGVHEPVLQRLVADAGRSSLLLQRTVDRYGHCAFTTEEMVRALSDLARWVETGSKPAS